MEQHHALAQAQLRPAGVPAAAPPPPRTVRVLGRSKAQENSDICGEYALAGVHLGSAVYQKAGSSAAIRYWQPMRRWVIDREGIRESEVCVAYADDLEGLGHPAHAQLIWNVWDATAQAHLADPAVTVSDAPAVLSFVGRSVGCENSSAAGEYDLLEMCHGRPAYRHRGGPTVIRYHAPEDRWLLSAVAESGNVCSAFAEAMGTPHPGFPELQWHFWEGKKNAFVLDPAVAALSAPALLHVVGRSPEAENARICGTYRLAGVYDGRPVYMRPDTRAVIRYAAKHNWWLIDCDGCAEPTLSSKLYQWILCGDAGAARDRCAAYCEALSSDHPGYSNLEWKVWDTRSGRHNADLWVRATTAPLMLRVSGRSAVRENGDIDGDYVLAGTHLGRPAYRRPGSSFAIRYWPAMRRWLIDREGLRNADTCVAYAEGPAGAEHPASSGFQWFVYETSRGRHLADPSVTVSVPPGAPQELPPVAPPMAAPAAPPAVPPAAPPVALPLVPPPAERLQAAAAKRPRPESEEERFASAVRQKLHGTTRGKSWFSGLFGGA
uniref:Uncharacterized protein n=1 Tax=Alexandrium monilatum TaxID=311494 RepID=A0A7S4TAI7_9DINO